MLGESVKEEIISALVERVRSNIAQSFGTGDLPEEQEEYFYRLFLEKPDGGCMPTALAGDDVYKDIQNKFYAMLDAVRSEFAERKRIKDYRIRIHIDANYDGETYVDCLYEPEPPISERTFLLFTMGRKPWNFWFESMDALKEELWEIYQIFESEHAFIHALLEKAIASNKRVFLATFEFRSGKHTRLFHHTVDAEDAMQAESRALEYGQSFGPEVPAQYKAVEPVDTENLVKKLAI